MAHPECVRGQPLEAGCAQGSTCWDQPSAQIHDTRPEKTDSSFVLLQCGGTFCMVCANMVRGQHPISSSMAELTLYMQFVNVHVTC